MVTRTAGTIAAADALYTLMQQGAALVGFFGVAAVEREKFIVLCGKLERQTLYITQPDCGFADVFDALMPIMAIMKGFTKRRLTPKTAGSVMPSKADRQEGYATCLVLAESALMATARTAPACATLPQVPIGLR